ncbi:MAG: HD domain-containing protein, partial [Clostridia bacterium]|nr:HD domain-containing protein [Clostridia bacterium]
ICFVLSCIAYWNRSFSVPLVAYNVETPFAWFIKNIIGLVIEYIFLLILTDYLSNITHNILQKLVLSMEKTEVANEELKRMNKEIQLISSELQEKYLQIDETQFKIIQFVAQCLGSHDLFTGRHVFHTQKYVELICHELVRLGLFTEQLTPAKIELFKNAAFLHDIGKIHVPEGILNKIGKFTNEEFDMMKAHTTEGYELLDFLPTINDGEFNRIAKEMALCHHEKWDGSGYPNKLKGTDIPLSARILAAADVMDAILSERLYKKPKSIEEAIEIFETSKGTHFEPCIVKAVINIKDKIAAIDQEFKTSEEQTNAKEKEWWHRYHSKIKS